MNSRTQNLLVLRVRSFARLLVSLPLIVGLGTFALAVVVTFLLEEQFPVSLGLWPLDSAGLYYEGYKFFSILCPILYGSWSVFLLSLYLRKEHLQYFEDGVQTLEEVWGNKSPAFLAIGVAVGLGYYFLHQLLTNNASPVVTFLLYLLQIIGFFLPSDLSEQAEYEGPILTMILLILAGLFVFVGSGLG